MFGFMKNLAEKTAGSASKVVDSVAGMASSAADSVTGVASSAADSVTGVASSAADSVAGIASSAADSVAGMASSAADSVAGMASSAADSVAGMASSAADASLKYLPMLERVVVDGLIDISKDVLNDEDKMRELSSILHQRLPAEVRFFVKEDFVHRKITSYGEALLSKASTDVVGIHSEHNDTSGGLPMSSCKSEGE